MYSSRVWMLSMRDSRHGVLNRWRTKTPRGIRTNRIRGILYARRRRGRSRCSREISFFPLGGRSSTTSSRASLEQVGSQAVALIAGAVTVTFQMACPFLSRYLVQPERSVVLRNQSGVRRHGFFFFSTLTRFFHESFVHRWTYYKRPEIFRFFVLVCPQEIFNCVAFSRLRAYIRVSCIFFSYIFFNNQRIHSSCQRSRWILCKINHQKICNSYYILELCINYIFAGFSS